MSMIYNHIVFDCYGFKVLYSDWTTNENWKLSLDYESLLVFDRVYYYNQSDKLQLK